MNPGTCRGIQELSPGSSVRRQAAWIRSDDTLPIRHERSTATMFYEPSKTALTDAGKHAALKLYAVCDRLLSAGATSLFDRPSVADADLAFMVQRLIISGDEVPSKARAFAEAQWKRPTIAKFVNLPRKPFVAY